jgi:flagellin-like protein
MSTEYKSNTGISPVVGIVLMVAITIALAALVGVFAFDSVLVPDSSIDAGVEVTENENGVQINWLTKGNAKELKIHVDGNELSTLSSPGDSVTVSATDSSTVSVIGTSEDGNTEVITSVNPSEDTTGGSDPEVVSGGGTTLSYSTPNSSAPNCSTVSYEESGTQADPYLVANDHELQCMSQNSNASYQLEANIDASGTASWNSGKGFKPVGSVIGDDEFNGDLYGDGYTIKGLTINRPSTENVGLIKRTPSSGGVEIKNLNLTSVDITGDELVGALVGRISDSNIVNVSVKGTVNAKYNIGGVFGTTSNVTIQDSTADMTVKASTNQGTVGVLVGYLGNSSTIDNSTSNGTVEGEKYTGGIAGEVHGSSTVQNSVSNANVNALKPRAFNKYSHGGIAGYVSNSSVVKDSSATGDISGDRSAGGIAGSVDDTSEVKNVDYDGSVSGVKEVGGLVGYQAGTLSNSSASGSVTASNELAGGAVGEIEGSAATVSGVTTSASVTGPEFVGGFVGYITESGATISNSKATGSATGTGSAFIIGGFAGEVHDSTIKNSISEADVDGDNEVGGFIGKNDSGTIENVYAAGSVSGGLGLMESNNGGTVTDSYWDTQATGQTSSDAGTGLTTSEMQGSAASSNMSGFDFSSTWETETSPDDYPALQNTPGRP